MFRVGVGELGRGVASLRLSGRGRGEEEGFKVEGEEWRWRLPGGCGGLGLLLAETACSWGGKVGAA
jgi:hypothetical protein